MTRDEAHEWLESRDPESYYFCIEWLGTQWQCYEWFGPAGGEDHSLKGTFVECVEFLKSLVERRSEQPTNG